MPILPPDFIEMFLDVKRETDKALLVSDGDHDAWLPKSQIEYGEEAVANGAGIIHAPEWLLKDKGLL